MNNSMQSINFSTRSLVLDLFNKVKSTINSKQNEYEKTIKNNKRGFVIRAYK